MSPLVCGILAGVSLGPLLLAAEPTKVACVGDSITEGSGLSNPSLESYPARFQRLAGTHLVVRNFGVSGRTLLKRGDYPYWNEPAFTQSHTWEPDIVTIKLGTNDSKPQNWRYGTNFVADLEELIASYSALPSHPRIVLCTPAPVYRTGAFSISPGIVATNIAPAVRAVATDLGLEVIDFHVLLADHQEWFPDTVHPNTRGAAVMAALLFDHFLGDAGGPAEVRLDLERLANGRTRAAWPADRGDWVLQSRSRLDSRYAWAVSTAVAYADGDQIVVTNPVAPQFLRLWKP